MIQSLEKNEYIGYLFDLDGTIYLGSRLLDRAAELIASLRKSGRKVGFLTNNSNLPRSVHADRLTKLGIPTEPNEVITAAYVTLLWLMENVPGARLWVVGEPPLLKKYSESGFVVVTDPSQAQVVISSFDKTFDYTKLHGALTAIRCGARFIATNPDMACPVDGDYLPDCAAITCAIQGASGVSPEVVIGKPSPIMGNAALRIMGLHAHQCMMVGDSLATDIAVGLAVGMPTTLVLTGVSKVADCERLGIHPTYIADGIWSLLTTSLTDSLSPTHQMAVD